MYMDEQQVIKPHRITLQNRSSLQKGETGVDGRVDSLTYSETNSSARQAGNFLGRLFK